MTEGHRNHLENFGSLANFNIQATDSIHGSDSSSTDRESGNKRKSVSFASEVSFQSISPAVSPKKQGLVTGSDAGGESEAGEQKQEVSKDTPKNAGKDGEEKGDTSKDDGTLIFFLNTLTKETCFIKTYLKCIHAALTCIEH